jgi:hypothetical protein
VARQSRFHGDRLAAPDSWFARGALVPWRTEITPTGHGDQLLQRLAAGALVRIVVAKVQGSGPRDAGAWMAVTADALIGTIGGGKLEFDAVADARALLAGQPVEAQRRFAL